MSVRGMVHIVDDEEGMRSTLQRVLDARGYACRTYPTAGAFLAEADGASGCVVTDVHLPDMDGLTLLERMTERLIDCPVLVITGFADIDLAVRAMKAGAIDFLPKPFTVAVFVEKVEACLAVERLRTSRRERRRNAVSRLGSLSGREAQVLELVVEGKQNKTIAWDLNISIKTVEVHRARIMEKTGSASVVELARLWEIAGRDSGFKPSRAVMARQFAD